MASQINILRTNNYVDSTSTYSNINVKSDIVIDSLINISFSKMNKVFLQNNVINSNISFNNFIRGKYVKDFSVNSNIPTTESNLSIDKFKDSQYIITEYNIIPEKNDALFTQLLFNGTTYINNIILHNYISQKINNVLLDSIIELNIVFKDSFSQIVDNSGDGAIKIDFSLFNNKYLQVFNIINNTHITGKHGIGLNNNRGNYGNENFITDRIYKGKSGGNGENGGDGYHAIYIIQNDISLIHIYLYDDNNKISGGFGAIGGNGGNGQVPPIFYKTFDVFTGLTPSADPENGAWSENGGTYIFSNNTNLWEDGSGYGWPAKNEEFIGDRYIFKVAVGETNTSGHYHQAYYKYLHVGSEFIGKNFYKILTKTAGKHISSANTNNIYATRSPTEGGLCHFASIQDNVSTKNTFLSYTKSNGVAGVIRDYNNGQKYIWSGDAGIAGSDGTNGKKIQYLSNGQLYSYDILIGELSI
jgi:hypothetical protein